MNLQMNIKNNRSTVVFFALNVFISASGALLAHKTASCDLAYFSNAIVSDKLFCVDAFLLIFLCFFYFCGILALLSLPLSFLFSFFNSYAVFNSIKASSDTTITAVFSCFLLTCSLIFFCIGALFSAKSVTDFRENNRKQNTNMLFDFFTIFIPGTISVLLMLIISSLIM